MRFFPLFLGLGLTACLDKEPVGDDTGGGSILDDLDGDGVLASEDCDDTDALVGAATTWYEDADGDGYAGGALTQEACEAPAGYESEITDCDDLDASSYPGGTEVCDGADNDCNGSVDDSAVDVTTWYGDGDGDGHGDPANSVESCDAPVGYVELGDDCFDADPTSFAGDTWYRDDDGDGAGVPTESTVACTQPSGFAATDDDCDDADAATYPDAEEICDDLDNNCDGVADEGIWQPTYYTYDDGPDGISDWITIYTYDADGNLDTVTVDEDADGLIDRIITYTWTADGQQSTIGYDLDADGVDDYTVEYYYDAAGNEIRAKLLMGTTTIEAYDYTYDADGNMLSYEVDSDGDGVVDSRATYTWDVNGNLVRTETDSDGNYLADEIITYTYDADDNLIEVQTDSDADGTVDTSAWYTYDSAGNLDRVAFDQDGDGFLVSSEDYCLLYDWSPDGSEESRIDFDSDCDDVSDLVHLERTYDSDGNRLTSRWDKDFDGSLDEIYTYTYDANGNLIQATEDTDADGYPEYTRTYDSRGNETQTDWDSDANGVVDGVEYWTYQCID
jgi:hypothetical protein